MVVDSRQSQRVCALLSAGCLLFFGGCHGPSLSNTELPGGFRVSADGASGQSVSGTVTGPQAATPGLKVGVVHVIRTLATADVTNGTFSVALPALIPAYPEDVVSKYEEARAKLKERKPMDPKYLRNNWPHLVFDGFWLTLFVDSDGDDKFTRGTDEEFLPQVTNYLVFQVFDGPPFSEFAKGWHRRYRAHDRLYRRTAQLEGIELRTN